MYTRVGTEWYMPPEMLEKNAYIGVCSDLFAAGIILYVLVLGNMPTSKKAESEDYLYQYIKKKKYEQYWTVIAEQYSLDLSSISEDFFHLVTTMIKYDYKKRFTIEEIKAHPWMQGEVATLQEVQEELQERKKTIWQKLNEDGYDSEETDVSEGYKEIYDEAIKRSCDATGYTIDIEKERKIKIFNPDCEKNTCFYSQFHPKILLGGLISYSKEKTLKIEVSPNSYKITMLISAENGNQFTFVC